MFKGQNLVSTRLPNKLLVAVALQVMEVFQPEAIVVCGGADSLSGDRLGCFNLSLEGHAGCMEFLAKFNVPMLILGGGRYLSIMFCVKSE